MTRPSADQDQGCNSIDILEFKAQIKAQVEAGVKVAFRKAPNREMVIARVKVRVNAIQKSVY